MIARVAAQLFNMTANNTIKFGGLSQFFGYSEVGFAFYDDTNPYLLDDLTTNNYWDDGTKYNTVDANGYDLYMIRIIQKYLSHFSVVIVPFASATYTKGKKGWGIDFRWIEVLAKNAMTLVVHTVGRFSQLVPLVGSGDS